MARPRVRWRWNAETSWQLTLPLPGVRGHRLRAHARLVRRSRVPEAASAGKRRFALGGAMTWNGYSRWRFVFSGTVVYLGGHGAYLPDITLGASPTEHCQCIQIVHGAHVLVSQGPANDVLAWWRRGR